VKKPAENFALYQAIDAILRQKGKVRIAEILAYCRHSLSDKSLTEAAVRKALSEMRSSEEAGIFAPVAFELSSESFYYSESGFQLDKVPLSEQEQENLRLGLELLGPLRYRQLPAEVSALLTRLKDSTEVHLPSDQSENASFICFEKSKARPGARFLLPLIRFIRDKTAVRIYYQPFYEDQPYFAVVHPYLLKEYQDRWYLLGLNHDKKELRTYALDRIWEVTADATPYVEGNINADNYFRNTVGIIAPSGPPPKIKLAVLKPQAQYLLSRPLHHSQNVEEENERSILFSYKVHPTYEFKAMILALGSDVKVIEPLKLREDIIAELKRGLGNYPV